MNNNILTKDIFKIIKEMKLYVENCELKREKVQKLLNDIIYLNNLYCEKITIVFLADKGIGKTSIINYILDFSYKRQKIKRNNKDKKIDIYQEVLDTGAGATTTFEVEILQSNSDISKIEIESYSSEEVLNVIREFCKKVYDDTFENKQYNANIPPELFRAIRNMAGLKIESLEKSKIDFAKELALEYENNYEDFKDEVIRRCNLEQRVKKSYECDFFNEKESIRTLFRKINLMNIEDAPLPKKVRVNISKKIFDFKSLGNIQSIVDTRGLENGVIPTDRKDIRDFFKYEKNKIIILVDKFKSPSQSLTKLLDDYIVDEECEVLSRLVYMANFADGEPENVLMEDGEAEVECDGIQYKKQQLLDYMKTNNIYIDPENIIFANPKRFMDSEGAIKIDRDDIDDYGSALAAEDYKMQLRNIKRKELIEDIKNVEKRKRNFLLSQIQLKYNEFSAIKNKELDGVKFNINLVVEKIREIKKNYYHISNIKNVDKILNQYIESNHPATLMAMNNRYGIYFEKDIYLVGSNELERICKKPLIEITKYVIQQIRANIETEKEDNVSIFIVQALKAYFYEYLEHMNSNFYGYLKEGVFNQEYFEFWNKVARRWGMGAGYVKDIITYYEKQLVEKESNIFVTNILNIEIDKFVEGLIELINDNI